MKKKVSIIIPVYNREHILSNCLKSVLNQDYKNIEIIIIDDGSTDKSYTIVKNYQQESEKISAYHIENGGASKARNFGLSKAKGEYICFIDSDDIVSIDYISTLVNAMETFNSDMAQFETINRIKNYSVDLSGNKSDFIHNMNQNDLLNEFFRVNGNPDMHTLCNRLIDKKVLINIKFKEGRMNEDVLGLFDIISNVNSCALISGSKYYYYSNNNGVTKSKFSKKDLDLLYMWDIVVKKTDKLFPNYFEYAVNNRKRANFTLLSKMLFSGYDKKDLEIRQIKKHLKSELHKDFLDLLKWKMPLSRKILLVFINYFF